MAEEHADQLFLETIIKALVDHPEAVKVRRDVDEMGVLLTLDVHADDMGKTIGRSGNTAKAIRTLLRVIGMKNNARVNLKINEPEGGRREVTSGTLAERGPSEAPQAQVIKSLDDAVADLQL